MIGTLLAFALQAPTASAAEALAPPGTILVPGGRTRIGTEEKELLRMLEDEPGTQPFAGALSAETPRHEAQVESFFLMATEVTNEQYLAFLKTTGARPPEHWGEARIRVGRESWSKEQERLRAAAQAQGKEPPPAQTFDRHAWWLANWNAPLPEGVAPPGWELPAGEEALPVVFVDGKDARSYARWAGLRLPDEDEYQRAVRGDSAQAFPWGSDWDNDKYAATNLLARKGGAYAVGSFPAGASRQGVLDLAGNVWEWTSSPYVPYAGYERRVYEVGFGSARHKVNALADWNAKQVVVVGGSFQNGSLMARCTTRRAADRSQATDALGFRCAASTRPGLDLANALLENEISPNVRPRDSRGMVEYAPETVVCADGWATSASSGSWTPPAGYAVIAGYRYVLFAPVKGIHALDPATIEKLAQSEGPLQLGFLSTNARLLEPDLAPGTYLISWRAHGPRRPTPSAPHASGTPDQPQLEEALRLDASLDNLIVCDLAGKPLRAILAKLDWEDARESRMRWLRPDEAPRTGTEAVPQGSRLLRLEAWAPCRGLGKGFAFTLTLRLAPESLGIAWRLR